MNTIESIIKKIPIFRTLSWRDIHRIAKISCIEEYPPSSLIYEENTPADGFYCVLKGEVYVLTKERNRQRVIAIIGPYTPFGIISLLTGENHSVTTQAAGYVSLLKIDCEKFRSFLKKCPGLSLQLSLILSERVKRKKNIPKRVFESLIIGIFSSSTDTDKRLSFLIDNIRNFSSGKIIIFSPTSKYKKYKKYITSLNNLKTRRWERFIVKKAGIDYIFVDVNILDKKNFRILVEEVTNFYSFILWQLPLSRKNIEFLVGVANYFIFNIYSLNEIKFMENTLKMSSLIQKDPFTLRKVKVLLEENLLESLKSYSSKKYSFFFLPQNSSFCKERISSLARRIYNRAVGVVLGSGGAYGFCHIGVLEVLEENNIPIDIICGSSMGSLVAALWAVGFSISEILMKIRIFSNKIKGNSIRGLRIPFRGFIKSSVLEEIMYQLFADTTFHSLRCELKIVAFDFKRRRELVFDKGYLYKAVAASCAMPGIFEPVEINNKIVFDGGVLNPLPTQIIDRYEIDKIIAVRVAHSLEESHREYKLKQRLNILDFIFGSIEVMQHRFVEESEKFADIIVKPDLSGLHWLDFDNIDEFVERGRSACYAQLSEIKKLMSF